MDVTNIARPSIPSVSPERSASPSAADPQQQQQAQQQPASDPAAKSSATEFESPIVSFDSSTGGAILEFRNASTGVETFQVPSKMALEYQRLHNSAADSTDDPHGPAVSA